MALRANGATTSVWLTTAADADVCVIGGGIASLTSAYLLARERDSASRPGVQVEALPRVPGLPFDSGAWLGARLHCPSRALEVSRDDGRQRVRTERGQVTAQAVVVATKTPSARRMPVPCRIRRAV